MDYDGDEYDDVLLPRAFGVDGEMPPEAGEPQNGMDFLRRVRWESRRLPGTVVAAAPPPQKTTECEEALRRRGESLEGLAMPQCPDYATPSGEWVTDFVSWFSALREKIALQSSTSELGDAAVTEGGGGGGSATETIARIPGPHDAEAWRRLFKTSKRGPPTQMAVRLDHVTVTAALGHLADLVEAEPATLSELPVLRWAFSLMVVLDKPLDGDTAAALRTILRGCCVRRSQCQPMDPLIPALNVVITASGVYFHQLD